MVIWRCRQLHWVCYTVFNLEIAVTGTCSVGLSNAALLARLGYSHSFPTPAFATLPLGRRG